MLQIEFRRLEVVRQLLTNRLFDNNPAGKTDDRARLGQIVIAQTREARGNAAQRRIGNTEMNNPPRSWNFASAALVLAICIRLRILSCIRAPPDVEKIISGSCFSCACFDRPRNFLPDNGAHAAAEKVKAHDSDNDRKTADVPSPVTTASLKSRALAFCCSSLLAYPGNQADPRKPDQHRIP